MSTNLSSYDEIISQIVAPLLAKWLTWVEPRELQRAIIEDRSFDLVFNSKEFKEVKREVKEILLKFPFGDLALDKVKDENIIKSFIKNDLMHLSPNHYAVIAYTPNALDYVIKFVVRAVEEIKN